MPSPPTHPRSGNNGSAQEWIEQREWKEPTDPKCNYAQQETHATRTTHQLSPGNKPPPDEIAKSIASAPPQHVKYGHGRHENQWGRSPLCHNI